jgi:hypothetical protein
MTDTELIKKLRAALPLGPTIGELLVAAADRIEEQAEIERTRPKPSRLEIAAMAMQAFIGTSAFIMDIPKHSLEYADALIVAAKEEK